MDVSRKRFLIGSMAVAAAGARRMFAAPAGTACGTPRLKVAVMSDIHLRFDVRPVECFGKKGRAIGSDATFVA